MVNLTRIYTRTGDDGTTSLGDFSRTSKNDLRLVAYADVDEANSALGVVAGDRGASLDADVRRAAAARAERPLRRRAPTCARPWCADPAYPPLRVDAAPYVDGLEAACDAYNEALRAAALVHPARRHARPPRTCTWRAP